MHKYEVICGNIGSVYYGNDRDEAIRIYNEYVELSKLLYGMPSGENVYLMTDHEIDLEWIGWLASDSE